jgi:hypothetical protein
MSCAVSRHGRAKRSGDWVLPSLVKLESQGRFGLERRIAAICRPGDGGRPGRSLPIPAGPKAGLSRAAHLIGLTEPAQGEGRPSIW